MSEPNNRSNSPDVSTVPESAPRSSSLSRFFRSLLRVLLTIVLYLLIATPLNMLLASSSSIQLGSLPRLGIIALSWFISTKIVKSK